jgi:hypothetical protein
VLRDGLLGRMFFGRRRIGATTPVRIEPKVQS